jgi:hypothetical protein
MRGDSPAASRCWRSIAVRVDPRSFSAGDVNNARRSDVGCLTHPTIEVGFLLYTFPRCRNGGCTLNTLISAMTLTD